jgi:thioredoxin reductase
MSAALVLGRANRVVKVFDHGRPRNHATLAMHGYLTRDGIAPTDFRRFARQELERYTTVSIEHIEVADAVFERDGSFTVVLDNGRRVTSRKLLIATGVTDNLPDLPGFTEFFGRSVFHCPYCDGWELRGQGFGVYGRGRRGHGLSLELTGWTSDIVLFTDGPGELDDHQRDELTRNKVTVREEKIARLEGRDGILERVVFRDGQSVERRVVFFTTGQTQVSPLAKKLGCEFNEKGTVRTGHHEATAVPGLFVAGDASRDVQWVVIAAAEGAEAAFAINQELIKAALR